MSRALSHLWTLPLLTLMKAMTRFPILGFFQRRQGTRLVCGEPKDISNMEKAVRGLIMGIAG